MKLNITLLIFLLLTQTVTLASAQTTEVGLSPGDTLVYSYEFSWASTNSSATIPVEYMKLNEINSTTISVKSVEGTRINIDLTRTYINGTKIIENGNIDVDTQVVEVRYGFLIIRANAKTGEKMYLNGGQTTVGDKETRSYKIGNLEVTHSVNGNTFTNSSWTSEVYYHVTSGVATEYNYENTETYGGQTVTVKETMKIQSMKIAKSEGIPLYIIFAVLIIIVAAVYILLKTYRTNTRN